MLSDKVKMLLSTLEDIKFSLELIQARCKEIHSSDDFLKDNDGLEKLDSVSMRLIAIGEGFTCDLCNDTCATKLEFWGKKATFSYNLLHITIKTIQ